MVKTPTSLVEMRDYLEAVKLAAETWEGAKDCLENARMDEVRDCMEEAINCIRFLMA